MDRAFRIGQQSDVEVFRLIGASLSPQLLLPVLARC